MPDQRSVMKEFRLLDQKRVSEGLAPAEEARYAQLRDLVGPEGAMGARGGFDVDAAAARLRESLVPAGARSRRAPEAPPIDPPADHSAGAGLGSALEAELFGPDTAAPEAEPLFGDAPLDGPPGAEGADAGAWGGDAAGGFEAGAAEAFPQDGATAAWDLPAAPDDPNAQGWDAQQPLDPSALPYDPGAQGWDPQQPVDPNAPPYDPGAQGWDAQQPLDPSAQPYDPGAQGWDPQQPLDPNAPPYDPGAQGWDAQQPLDPNAQPYDPGAQGWDAQQPWDPDAAPYGAEAPAQDAAAPWDPSAQGWADPQQPFDPSAAPFDATEPAQEAAAPFDPSAAGWDPQQPYDPNAAPFAAWAPPQEAAAPFDPGATGWDPQQPYDPDAAPFGAAEPAQDAAAPFDPGATGWDPQQPWEAGAPLGDQQLQDGALSAWEAAQPGEQGAVGWSPAAEDGLVAPDGAGGYADGAVAAFEPGAEEFAANDAALAAEAGAAEPHDVAAEGAWDPHALAEGAAPLHAEPEGSSFAGEEGGWQTTSAAELLGEAGGDGAAEYEPAQPFTADLAALPPAGWDAEPAPAEMAPVDPSALGEYDGAASAPPEGEDGGLASMLPFDPAAEAAVGPGHAPEGFPTPTGEYDDTAGFAAAFSEQAPPDLRSETSDFHAAQGVSPEDAPSWAPEGLDDGFELASGGSFDAAASAAIPEWAFDAAEPPVAADPTRAFSLGAPSPDEAAPAADAPLSAETAPLAVGPSAEAGPLDEAPEPAAPLLAPLQPEPAMAGEGAAAPDADPAGALDDFAVDVDLDLAADLGAELEPAPDATAELYARGRAPAPVAVAVAVAAPAPHAGEPYDDGADLAGPPDDTVDLAGPAPLLDFSQPDFSADDPAGDDAFATVPVAPAALRPPAAHLELEDHPAAVREEELPTLEGEEILEELPTADASAPALDFAPPPAPAAAAIAAPEPSGAVALDPIPAPPPLAGPPPAPAAAIAPPPPPPPPSEPCEIRGVHRVVVHTLEGQVKRGVLEDADLAAPALALAAQPGDAAEEIATESVKAIFFMLSPGEAAPPAQGKKVRVTFRDGRQVAGFSPEYREDGAGFFMVPVDTRTNTGRIWVYRAALRQVSVS
jgi:hypothetical protein